MDSRIARLTEKEKAALRLIVEGHDAKSMARALDLSVHTINDRLRAARRKLGVTSSRAQLPGCCARPKRGHPKSLRTPLWGMRQSWARNHLRLRRPGLGRRGVSGPW